jgi:hypothetical protein
MKNIDLFAPKINLLNKIVFCNHPGLTIVNSCIMDEDACCVICNKENCESRCYNIHLCEYKSNSKMV